MLPPGTFELGLLILSLVAQVQGFKALGLQVEELVLSQGVVMARLCVCILGSSAVYSVLPFHDFCPRICQPSTEQLTSDFTC